MKLSDYNAQKENSTRISDKEKGGEYHREGGSGQVSEKEIMDKYNQYKDLSSEQLNQELFKEVARQKANGSFSYDRLEGMLEGLRGSLGEENYQNMKRILESLK